MADRTGTTPEPGWYPDPSGQPALRWWDGNNWSNQTQAAPPPGTMSPLPSAQQQAPSADNQSLQTRNGRVKPVKKRRVFMWFFLAVNLVFLIILIAVIASYAGEKTGPTHAQLVSACYNHNWYPLYKSQADCVSHYGQLMQSAGNAGRDVGGTVFTVLVIALWAAADVILGIGRLVVVFARRR